MRRIPMAAEKKVNFMALLLLDRSCIDLVWKQLLEKDIRYLLEVWIAMSKYAPVIPFAFVPQIDLEMGIKNGNDPKSCDLCTPF